MYVDRVVHVKDEARRVRRALELDEYVTVVVARLGARVKRHAYEQFVEVGHEIARQTIIDLCIYITKKYNIKK